MRRPILAAMACMILASCGDNLSPLAQLCVEATKDSLKSPRSMELVGVTDGSKIAKDHQPFEIFVRFDAANAYGTMLRGIFICQFRRASGKVEVVALSMNGEPYTGQLFRLKKLAIELKLSTQELKKTLNKN